MSGLDCTTSTQYPTCSNISGGVAFIVWLIILIIIIAILRYLCIHWFSTIVFSFVVATIILCCFFPLDIREGRYHYKSEDGILGFIVLITFILVVIYIIWQVFSDRDAACLANRGAGSFCATGVTKKTMTPTCPPPPCPTPGMSTNMSNMSTTMASNNLTTTGQNISIPGSIKPSLQPF